MYSYLEACALYEGACGGKCSRETALMKALALLYNQYQNRPDDM